MASAARRLLNHIVDTRLLPLEERQLELEASAVDTATLPDEIRNEAVREKQDARDLDDAFEDGLARAARERNQPVTLDDRDPTEDRVADALIRFLVKPELASVVSEPVGPEHYRYHVTIDWAALDRVAAEAGVSLEDALRR